MEGAGSSLALGTVGGGMLWLVCTRSRTGPVWDLFVLRRVRFRGRNRRTAQVCVWHSLSAWVPGGGWELRGMR